MNEIENNPQVPHTRPDRSHAFIISAGCAQAHTVKNTHTISRTGEESDAELEDERALADRAKARGGGGVSSDSANDQDINSYEEGVPLIVSGPPFTVKKSTFQVRRILECTPSRDDWACTRPISDTASSKHPRVRILTPRYTYAYTHLSAREPVYCPPPNNY